VAAGAIEVGVPDAARNTVSFVQPFVASEGVR
jgi:hypothetical protein